MCGIVGYIGSDNASSILTDSLQHLEYRGYDSAGIAIITDDGLKIEKCKGKLKFLKNILDKKPLYGTLGIGHTRWATHGPPSKINAHPHQINNIAVVHNGIIENYLELKEILLKEGHIFESETDTEIISHLISKHLDSGLSFEESVKKIFDELKGAYALLALYGDNKDRIIAVKKESPMVIGLGDGENYIASDIPAIMEYTNKVIFMDDEEWAIITREGVDVYSFDGRKLDKEITTIQWNPVMAEKAGYKHFMQKEIFEQPMAITDTLRGRLSIKEEGVTLEGLDKLTTIMDRITKIHIVACGTSWHAGLVGKFYLETLCGIPAEVDLASEYRYRDPIVDSNTLLLAISQSGETADTLAAVKEAKSKGAFVLSVVNVVGSSLTRFSDEVFYIHAGPEIGVASTKAYTTQLVSLLLLSIYMATLKKRILKKDLHTLIQSLWELPSQVKNTLNINDEIFEISGRYINVSDFLFLGRGLLYPVALEGALKLKEISYIHAEGYPAGEMKHGPIALVNENLPVVVVAPSGDISYNKICSNIEEIKARKGMVIVFTDKDDAMLKKISDSFILLPVVHKFLKPVIFTIPLQLLAYHIADLRGTDVDQPRNLAKSVTVE